MGLSNSGVYIYTRFSSGLQRPESCEDQERKTRKEFDRKGIRHNGAHVLSDEGITGQHDDRPGFQKLLARVRAGLVKVLGVDELSRLSRSRDGYSVLSEIDSYGVRLIAVAEGIDSNEPNWDVNAI